VAVEVAARTVVVLGGARICVSSQDLGIAKRDAGVKCVGDGRMTQRVGADVARYARGCGDPDHHPIDVASIYRSSRHWTPDQRPFGAFAAADFKGPQDRHGDRHRRRLVALAHQMQDPMPAQGLVVVLDPDGSGLGGSQRVDTQEVGKGAVVDGDGLSDLEEPDELESVQTLGAGLSAWILGSRA
jgi:hypothetical protein